MGEEIERSAALIAAPLRCSPADVAEQAEQTDARTSSSRSRHYFGVAIVFFPVEMTTRVVRGRRGPKICAKRHPGGAAGVIFHRKRPRRRRKYQQRQINWTGRHVGSAAPANIPGDLVARQEKTQTSSKRSNQALSRVPGL